MLYRERRLYQPVLEGRRPARFDMLSVCQMLVAMLGILPSRPAAFVLAYRFKVWKRTAFSL